MRTESRGAQLIDPGVFVRPHLTVWTEDKFTVRPAGGIKDRDTPSVRVAGEGASKSESQCMGMRAG